MLALTPLTTPQQNVIEAPHVMILGAGASVAACPKGDKNGRRLPVMRNLVEMERWGQGFMFRGERWGQVTGLHVSRN